MGHPATELYWSDVGLSPNYNDRELCHFHQKRRGIVIPVKLYIGLFLAAGGMCFILAMAAGQPSGMFLGLFFLGWGAVIWYLRYGRDNTHNTSSIQNDSASESFSGSKIFSTSQKQSNIAQRKSEAGVMAYVKLTHNVWDSADLIKRTSLLGRTINPQDDRLFLAYVHAPWTQIPYDDQMKLVMEVMRHDGNNGLIKIMAKMVANCFSAESFNLAFSQKPLAANWTFEDALAIWYCLGRFCFQVAVGSIPLPEADALNVVDVGAKELMRIWNMPERTFKRFRQFNETKLSSMFSLYTSLNDEEMFARFFALIVSEITGHDVSFSVDDFSAGLFIQILDGKEIDMDPFLHNKIYSLFVLVKNGVCEQFRGYNS
jgi:hypothetical protein